MPTPNASNAAFRRHQILTILGLCIVNLPTGLRWLWGNLTVYTTSYFYSRGGHPPKEVNTPWMLAIYELSWATGVFLAGPLMKCTNRSGTLLLGILIFDAGFALSYFAVRFNSITALNLTFGVVIGCGDGILETVGIVVVSEWAGKRQGAMISLVFSSGLLGVVFTNQFVTWYINPANLKPDLRIGPSSLFTQISVLEKTPSVFILLAIISIAVQGPAMFLIRCHRQEAEKKSTWRAKLSCYFKSAKAKLCCYTSSNKIPLEERCITSSLNDELSLEDGQGEQINPEAEDEEANMTLRQVIRTLTFHALWFGSSCAEFSKVWLFNYYKIFGLRYNEDDHFLTDLGTIMAVVSSLSRSLWGCTIDYLGIKNTLTVCSASGTLVTAFFFFTPQVSRWLYLVFTLVFGSVINGFSILVAVVIVRVYGKSHFSINYGAAGVPIIITNLVAPLTYQGFLDTWGWFPLLCTMAVFNGISTIVQIVVIPKSAGKK